MAYAAEPFLHIGKLRDKRKRGRFVARVGFETDDLQVMRRQPNAISL